MGITEIKKFLTEHKGKKYSAEQLSNYLDIGIYSVYSSLRKLRKEIDKKSDYLYEWNIPFKGKPYLLYCKKPFTQK